MTAPLPRAAALAVALLATVGCGPSTRFAPVSGRVTLNGKPLAGARVAFQPIGAGPKAATPGPGSVGTTDADGRFSLTVIASGAQQAGAVVGTHRVIVSKTDIPVDPAAASDEKAGVKGPQEMLPKKYNDDTELTCDVPEAGKADANFDLKSP